MYGNSNIIGNNNRNVIVYSIEIVLDNELNTLGNWKTFQIRHVKRKDKIWQRWKGLYNLQMKYISTIINHRER